MRRQVGLGSATAIVAGEMIAVGIFLTPAAMIKTIGSPLWLLLVWVAMGLMALCGAICYGELARRFPEAGGGYVYLREAYGNRLAFLYGWMCFLVMDPGITAALAVGMTSYAGYVVPLSPVPAKAIATGSIVALAAANIVGIRIGAALMRWLTLVKLGSLAAIAVWGLGLRFGDWGNLLPFVGQRPGSAPLPAALAGGIVAAFFSFGGWWDVSKIGGEIRDPVRTLPRALTLGVVTGDLGLYVDYDGLSISGAGGAHHLGPDIRRPGRRDPLRQVRRAHLLVHRYCLGARKHGRTGDDRPESLLRHVSRRPLPGIRSLRSATGSGLPREPLFCRP